MAAYLTGTVVTIGPVTLKDPTGQLTDATVTMTVTQPDGTTASVNVTRLSLGTYQALFTPTQDGEHTWTAVSSGALIAEGIGGFRAVAPPLYATVGAYRDATGDTTTPDQDVLGALADALDAADDFCQRRFRYGTYTETLYVYPDGKCYPKATPIIAVTSPNVAQVSIQGAGVWLGYYNPLPVINTGGVAWSAAFPPQVALTYTGGYTPATYPRPVRNGVIREAYRALHADMTLASMPVGAKSVSVGDISISGALSPLGSFSGATIADWTPYVRRQVRGWQ